MQSLRIDVWSDIVCPWCYVGKRRLEAALERFPDASEVTVVWRAFELDPRAPKTIDPSISYVERLARKYRVSVEHAARMIARMTEVARADGLEFRFDIARPGNTFDAHRLLHWVRERGDQTALKERLFRAYMMEGAAIGETGVLARLAAEVGLDSEEALFVLESDTGARQVRADEEEAHAMQVTGVPFYVFDGRFGIPGAQSPDVLLHVLTRAWNDRNAPSPPTGESTVCGPDGCE